MNNTFTSIFHEAVIPLNEGLFSKKDIPDQFFEDAIKICKYFADNKAIKKAEKKNRDYIAGTINNNFKVDQIKTFFKNDFVLINTSKLSSTERLIYGDKKVSAIVIITVDILGGVFEIEYKGGGTKYKYIEDSGVIAISN